MKGPEFMKKPLVIDLVAAHALPHGTAFRSKQVAGCRTCGALTNAMVVRHRHLFYHQTAVEYVAQCPNALHIWHEQLRQKIAMRNPHHPRMYRTALEQEIRNLKKRASPNVRRDIVGKTDAKPTLETYETDPVEVTMPGFTPIGRSNTKVIVSPKTTVTTQKGRAT